jgi:preprotein translocase subunit SecD
MFVDGEVQHMIRNVYTRLALILVILALALWIDLNDSLTIYNPIDDTRLVDRDVSPRLGLDLQGGLQVLLEADVPQDTPVDAESMETARTIMENRTNALGVTENVLQIAGERRIVGEFPGLKDTDAVLRTIQQTGLLEFVTQAIRTCPEHYHQTDFVRGEPRSPVTATVRPTDVTTPS